ncbi:MAG: cytochrome c nitrite reductase small subunit [Deltaproteobacteria bacterium]|nr:cytochrome c nitrite reductase small subunit [Deltaproteobacteria bacterium]
MKILFYKARGSQGRLPRQQAGGVLIIVTFAVLTGLFFGLGAFTFGYGKGWSYLSNDPSTCANCHVMQGHFDSWVKSSHHTVAVCNDCHLPHNFLGKWITKGDNGFFHSLAFTLGGFHEPIQIKPRNRDVTQGTCVYCHQQFIHPILITGSGEEIPHCASCHSDVGHALKD